MTSERCTIHALEYNQENWHTVLVSRAVLRGLSRPFQPAQVLPFYWPYEKSLQSAVLQSLRSAEHGLGRGSFGTQNLRVTNQNESDGHITVSAAISYTAGTVHNASLYVQCFYGFKYATVQGITEVGILEFKRVEGPAELQVAKYCMSQMRDMRSSSSRLYSHSFMPMATCEVVGSELRSVSPALKPYQKTILQSAERSLPMWLSTCAVYAGLVLCGLNHPCVQHTLSA